MERLRRGRSRIEFERFVADRSDDLLRTAYLMVWDPSEAEDLAQECLLRVARRWSRVRGMDNPGAYARRVLVNLALDTAHRRSRRQRELQPQDVPVPEAHATDQLGQLELRAELREVMGTLTVRQRTMLVLRYFEDLSEGQVAELLDCSTGNVKSSTARALERLRDALGTSYEHANATTGATSIEEEPAR